MTQETEDVVARLRNSAHAYPCEVVGHALNEAADLIQSLSDRIDVLEDKLADAYKRGWREGCEDMLDANGIDGAISYPHKDVMGEGCGNFMAEYYAALHQEHIKEGSDG